MTKILLVEDEPDLQSLLEFNLREAGYDVLATARGGEAVSLCQSERPDLVLLDLMLPDIPGTQVCRTLRSSPELRQTPVIMLTARGEEIDRVVGFEVGADDYVVKPFSVRELLLRIQAVLRRQVQAGAPVEAVRPAVEEDAADQIAQIVFNGTSVPERSDEATTGEGHVSQPGSDGEGDNPSSDESYDESDGR